MSGHNKWSKIKRKKEVSDAQKSKIFSKIVRLITSEIKNAKGDITSPSVRTAIEKAKEANMPNDNIERAIKKGSEQGGDLEQIVYEAYGPAGIGLIIETLTDNKNRAAQEVKHILSTHGASLGAVGSVTWSFKREGREWIPTMTMPVPEDSLDTLESLIDALEENDDVLEVYTNAE